MIKRIQKENILLKRNSITKIIKMKKLIEMLLIAMVSFNSNAQVIEKTYHDYAKTKIKEIYQVNNDKVKNGTYKEYWITGPIAKDGFYKNGMQDGTWKFYDEKGRLESIVQFSNDKYNGTYKVWCNLDGIKYLCNSSVYVNGDELEENLFYAEGKQKKSWKKNGLCQTWYSNGQKEYEWKNINGLSVGGTNEWTEEGLPVRFVINGKTYRRDDDGKLFRIYYDSLIYHIEEWLNNGDTLLLEKKYVTDTSGKGLEYVYGIYNNGDKEIKVHQTIFDKKWKTYSREQYGEYLRKTTWYSNLTIKETDSLVVLPNGKKYHDIKQYYPNGKIKTVRRMCDFQDCSDFEKIEYDEEGNKI